MVGATGTSGPSTRRSLPGGASKPYRAGAGLFSAVFLEGGLGREALERTPPNSADRPNVSSPSPLPRAFRGSAIYTEPQDPSVARDPPGNCPGLVGGPVGNIGPVGDATPYPAGGGSPPTGSWVAPYSRGQRGRERPLARVPPLLVVPPPGSGSGCRWWRRPGSNRDPLGFRGRRLNH